MAFRNWLVLSAVTLAFAGGYVARGRMQPIAVVHASAADRVFEMRTYTASAGKFENVKTRFRDHTIRIFNRHGMESIGYWTPADAPGAGTTLVYIIAHASREQAVKNWAAFNADPEWVKVRADSNVDGNIVAKAESVFLNPVDFSPIK
ncbi:MAG: NIPSNAP family protein [Acidobacteriota bacterium]